MPDTMTSRERFFRCLEFRSPDRAPRQLWCVPYIPEFRKAELEQILREYPDDLVGPDGVLPPDERRRDSGPVPNSYIDDWGCLWVKGEPGVVGEVKGPPLADWAALDRYRAPWSSLRNARWHEAARQQERNLASANPRLMMAGSTVRPFERMQFIRGSEALFLDLGYMTAEVRRLRDLVHEFYLAEMQGWAATPVDAVSFMDDWGSQQGLLIAPALWREFFKPLYRDYCDILRKAGKKIFFHSDGHIAAIYPDLVELGIDAINSQLFAMDIEALARLYRGKVAFWGELDRQRILPFGTPGEIRASVGRVRRALDDGRGGVIANFTWGAEMSIDRVRIAYDAWLAPVDQLP